MKIIANMESHASGFNTMRLGALKNCLEVCEKQADVRFNFGGLTPRGINAYRGFPGHLALSYGRGNVNVGDLLEKINTALYAAKYDPNIVSVDTPVWVDNPGDATNTGLVMIGYDEVEQQVILYGEKVEVKYDGE